MSKYLYKKYSITPEDIRNEKYDYKFQVYFIEVEPDNTHVTSQVIPITKSAKKLEVENSRSVSIIKEPREKKKDSTCICQEQYKDLIWGAKVSCEFRKKVVEISKELWPKDYMNMANNLMAIMALETNKTFDPKTENKNGYFGLTGFGKSTVEDFQRTLDKTITKQKILNCTGEEQLFYVKERLKFVQKHLMNNGKGGILSDFTDLYLAILYPAKSGLLIGEDPKDKIIFDASKGLKYELEYRQNPSFMKEPGEWENKVSVTFKRNGKETTEILRGFSNLSKAKTYRWEVTKDITNYKKEGENHKVITFSCQNIEKKEKKSSTCLEDHSQCFNYEDAVNNPKLNNQSDNVNKNRWHRTKRINNSHPEGYYHTGTDILASSGTEVRTMLCGKVYAIINTFEANEYRVNSLGNYVIIESKDKNGRRIYIKYCHLDKVSVSKGQSLKHGDPIGKSGSTGNAASVYKNGKLIHGIDPKYRHVHIEAATSSSFGNTRVDPEKYMKTKFDETTKGNTI